MPKVPKMELKRRQRHRQDARRLTEAGRLLLKQWMPDAPKLWHAKEAQCSRRTLNRLRNGQAVDPDTQEKVAIALGHPTNVLFESLAELQIASKPLASAGRDVVEDVVHEVADFDVIDTSAKHLRSQSLHDREQLLLTLRQILPVADFLRGDMSSPETAEVVAFYYLTLTDQLMLSNDPGDVRLAPVLIEHAVSAAEQTRNFPLHVTCLLHRASFLYSSDRFKEAKRDRITAEQMIGLIADKPTQEALATRLAGDRARQMIEDDVSIAEPAIRGVIEQADGLDDSCQKGSNLRHLGMALLRENDCQGAAWAMDAAHKMFSLSHSKNLPLQRTMLSRWRAIAHDACASTSTAGLWSDAIKQASENGFAAQLRRIRQTRVSGNGFRERER